MTEPVQSLHKLLTASELGQSVHFNASEVQELSEAIIAVHAQVCVEQETAIAILQSQHSTRH